MFPRYTIIQTFRCVNSDEQRSCVFCINQLNSDEKHLLHVCPIYSKKKKKRVTAEVLDLCNKRRDLRKKRFEPEGSQKFKEVNNNIKRCMKRLKKTGYENSVVRLKKI